MPTALVAAPAGVIGGAAAAGGGGGAPPLAVTVDADGASDYSAIHRQGEAATRIVYASPADVREKPLAVSAVPLPTDAEVAATTARTREALAAALGAAAAQPTGPAAAAAAATAEASYVRYTPANGRGGERVIKLVAAPVDPMAPGRFKQARGPAAPPSPPAPVLHSPTRKVTKAQRDAWRIPPCVSNWKNNKGYTIALDKRLAADGRGRDVDDGGGGGGGGGTALRPLPRASTWPRRRRGRRWPAGRR
ncbi:hypothetical protein I4F81_011107 [Pyropia yezoensis]|uniref:Uncharacterized protein n=1 Tax=Pyropia yezoensis TaxID=2788 RepID=A0ACC3CEL0_PYRYE|nr:hypothetical protein I4F81_011107 [Neopyropia yezoensis]